MDVWLINRFTKININDATKDPEYWITDSLLSKVDLQILGVKIHDAKMMNHTSSNLFEEYMNIVENIENDLDDTENSCIIKQLRDTISDN